MLRAESGAVIARGRTLTAFAFVCAIVALAVGVGCGSVRGTGKPLVQEGASQPQLRASEGAPVKDAPRE